MTFHATSEFDFFYIKAVADEDHCCVAYKNNTVSCKIHFELTNLYSAGAMTVRIMDASLN